MPFLLFFSSINLMDSSPTSKPKEETARKEGTGKNRLKNLSKKLKDIIGLYQIRFLLSKYLCSISAGAPAATRAPFFFFFFFFLSASVIIIFFFFSLFEHTS